MSKKIKASTSEYDLNKKIKPSTSDLEISNFLVQETLTKGNDCNLLLYK